MVEIKKKYLKKIFFITFSFFYYFFFSHKTGDNYVQDFKQKPLHQNSPYTIMSNKNIVSVQVSYQHTYIYLSNGDLYVFGATEGGQLSIKLEEDYVPEPFLLKNDPNILYFCGDIISVWTSEEHLLFPEIFKLEVLQLLFALKRLQKLTKIKIPKFVIFEIIKLL